MILYLCRINIKEIKKNKKMNIKLGLCRGRHELPVKDYIYENEIDPLDLDKLENTAFNKLKDYDSGKLELYVTGLTVALVSVLNVCRILNINVLLYHYNRDTDNYYKQEVY